MMNTIKKMTRRIREIKKGPREEIMGEKRKVAMVGVRMMETWSLWFEDMKVLSSPSKLIFKLIEKNRLRITTTHIWDKAYISIPNMISSMQFTNCKQNKTIVGLVYKSHNSPPSKGPWVREMTKGWWVKTLEFEYNSLYLFLWTFPSLFNFFSLHASFICTLWFFT